MTGVRRLHSQAPGVCRGEVTVLTALSAQAWGDHHQFVDLCEFLHLQQPLSNDLCAAGHHSGVVPVAASEGFGLSEGSDLFWSQRLPLRPGNVLEGEGPSGLELQDCLIVVAGERQHRHGRVRVGSAGAGSEVAAIVPQHLEREVRAHAVSEDCAHPIDRREALSVVAGTEHEHFRSFGDDRCRDQAQTSLSSDPFTVEIYAVASW